MNQKIIIGIDPDTDKSGVAVYENGKIKLTNLDYCDLFDLLKSYDNVLVVIEKGETNKAIFNANKAKNKRIAAKIGVSVGRNFEATNIIEKFCIKHDIKHDFYVPKSAKWNNVFVQKAFELEQKRTNEEQRDALRCIFKYIKK